MSKQMQEFFSKNRTINRRLSQEDKQLILSNLVTKNELIQGKLSLDSQVDENARLEKQVSDLKKENGHLNEKLDNCLKVIKDYKSKEEAFKQQQNDIDIRDETIKQLKEKLYENNNERPMIVAHDQEQRGQDVSTDAKDELAKLKEQLESKQIDLDEVHTQLERHKQEQDEKITKINKRLQAVVKGNSSNSNQHPMDGKHMSILHMNIKFVEDQIAYLQKNLLEKMCTISNLQTEQKMAAEILGLDTIEESLLQSAKSFINKYEMEKKDQKVMIHNLTEKLKIANEEKLKLEKELEGFDEVDKERLKEYFELRKLELKGRTNRRKLRSASDSPSHEEKHFLPTISGSNRVSHRPQRPYGLRKNTSVPDLQTTQLPNVVNLSISTSGDAPRIQLRKGVLADKYLHTIGKDVEASKYFELGIELGLGQAELDRIKANNQDDAGIWVFRVLTVWKQRLSKHDNERKTLADALENIGRVDLAETVRSHEG